MEPIGFTAAGNVFHRNSEFDKGNSVRNLGTGFRYCVAEKVGTVMGIDFAKSQDDFAFYVVFSTVWLR